MEHITTIDGKKYRYLKIGTGERKLVILWGFASYKESVLSLVVKNFSDYTVLVPEYPYHNGFEDANLDDISITDIAKYLLPLLKQEDFVSFSAIGFSFGGLVLLEMLKNFKFLKISQAVVWSSPLLGYHGINPLCKYLADIYSKTSKDVLELMHKNKLLEKALLKRGIKVFDPVWFKKYLDIFKSYQLTYMEKDTRCLFIYDPKDILVSIKNSKYLRDNFSPEFYTLAEIVGGGHFGTKDGRVKALLAIKNHLQA